MNSIDSITIAGGRRLSGAVDVQGSKNAALPVLAACILVPGQVVLHHCPIISDITCMLCILSDLGCSVRTEDGGHTLLIDAGCIKESSVASHHASGMRSSIFLLGALLGRMGEAVLPYPGGCIIGARPIDQHIRALSGMGVHIETREMLHARADGLRGADITLSVPSVGATENVILAAVLAEGETTVHNAAREPEIVELCRFLKQAGAGITGEGTPDIRITGVKALHPIEYTVASDRIVAGTYALAAAITRGRVCLKKAPVEHMGALLFSLRAMGCAVGIRGDEVLFEAKDAKEPLTYVYTSAYPGFPTDLQSQLLSALCVARGESIVEETIFEGRFKIVDELRRMGADIMAVENIAHIKGVRQLHGAQVTARELRGGAALVLAGLAAEGRSVVDGAHYIARGYEDICRDLNALGGSLTAQDEGMQYEKEYPGI